MKVDIIFALSVTKIDRPKIIIFDQTKTHILTRQDQLNSVEMKLVENVFQKIKPRRHN